MPSSASARPPFFAPSSIQRWMWLIASVTTNHKKPMTPTKPPPLTDEEIKDLRAVLEQDRFVRRFWSSVRTWVIAIAAVVAGVTVGFEALAKVVRFLAGK